MHKFPDWFSLMLIIIYTFILGFLHDNYGHTKIYMRLKPIVIILLLLLLIWSIVKDLKGSGRKEGKTNKLVFNYILLIGSILYLLFILGDYLNSF